MNRASISDEIKDFSNLEALRDYHQDLSQLKTNSKKNITLKINTSHQKNENSPNHNNNSNRNLSINKHIQIPSKTTQDNKQQIETKQPTITISRTSLTTSSPQKSTAQRIFRTSILAVRSARMFALAGKQKSDIGVDELKLSQLITQLLTLPFDLKDQQQAEIMITILSKKNKSVLESQYLSRCLLNLSLFSSNLQILADPASQRVILSEISDIAFPKGHSIFKFGEYGNHYYVVLKGSVYCYIPKSEFKEALLEEQINLERQVIKMKQNNTRKRNSLQPESQQQSTDTNNLINTSQEQQQQKLTGIQEILLKSTNSNNNNNSHQQRGSSLGIIKHEVILTDEFEQASANNPEMTLVKIYHTGEAFGEIALMTKERRTATMVCREDSHLMVLSKEGFDRIIGKCEEGQVRQRVSFLKSFAFFASVGDSQLMSLLHFFTETMLPQKTVVYKEGDQVNQIYFIRQGEVHIQKYLDSQQQNDDGLCNNGQIHEQSQTQMNDLTQIEQQEQQYNQKHKRKILTLKILGPSQYFGQDEIFSHQAQRSLRAIALQSTVLLSISKRDLFSALKQYKQLDTFRSQNEMKQQWQKEREQEYITTTEQITQIDDSKSKLSFQSNRMQNNNNNNNTNHTQQYYSKQLNSNNNSSNTFSARSPLHSVIVPVKNPLIFSTSLTESFQLGQKQHNKNNKYFLANTSSSAREKKHNDVLTIPQDTTIKQRNFNIMSSSTLSFRKISEQSNISTTLNNISSRIQLTSPQNKLSACFSTKTIHVPHYKTTETVSKNNLTLPSVKLLSEDIPYQHNLILQQFQKNNQDNEEIMTQLLKKQAEKNNLINSPGLLDMSSSSISRLPVFHILPKVAQSPQSSQRLHNHIKNTTTETASNSTNSRRNRSNHTQMIFSQSQKDLIQQGNISNTSSSRFSSSCRQIKVKETDSKIPKQLLNYLLSLPNSTRSSQIKQIRDNNSSVQNNQLASSSILETSITISPLNSPDAIHEDTISEINQQQQYIQLGSQRVDHINEDYIDLSMNSNSRSFSSNDRLNQQQQQQHIPVMIRSEDSRQFSINKIPQIKRVIKNKKPFYFKLIEQNNKIDTILSNYPQQDAQPK